TSENMTEIICEQQPVHTNGPTTRTLHAPQSQHRASPGHCDFALRAHAAQQYDMNEKLNAAPLGKRGITFGAGWS
ncbi:hypothetical protein, partial [Tateyamaria omphalii]|uniref:hypothetical protein n=1 Tax=Tateyamaria omphalii TaxID=299262 RepID=UPI001E286806